MAMIQTLKYQDYTIHCTIEGTGTPILFLHGWPTNSNLWNAQKKALQSEFKVITFDWLGFGQSDKPLAFHYTFPHMKEMLDVVIASLIGDSEKVTLVAHDIGGPPTILWASENPERVQKLILLNTLIYTFKTNLDAFSEFLLHTPILKDIFVSPFGLNMVMKTNTKSGHPALPSRINEILAPYKKVETALKRKTLTEPLEDSRQRELYHISEQYKAMDVQKYLVIAKKDPLLYAHINRLSQENPTVPVYPILNCGHFIPIDQPEALNGILLQILEEGQA